MSEDLTDEQISLLCDIGGPAPPEHLTEDKKRDLEQLISGGYAEHTESPSGSRFKLTAKAWEFLSKRGVGLNEA
jgi:hypothetical protein